MTTNYNIDKPQTTTLKLGFLEATLGSAATHRHVWRADKRIMTTAQILFG